MTNLNFFFSNKTFMENSVLQLDPVVKDVFNGPYPFGIDPVSLYLIYTYRNNICFAGSTCFPAIQKKIRVCSFISS